MAATHRSRKKRRILVLPTVCLPEVEIQQQGHYQFIHDELTFCGYSESVRRALEVAYIQIRVDGLCA